MVKKAKEFLISTLGVTGVFVFYILFIAIEFSPVYMIGLPWYATLIITTLMWLSPSFASFILPIIIVIAFPNAISSGLCPKSIIFYLSAAVYLIPYAFYAISFLITAIGVLQTKVNRKNEKSPAKFTRPKMGITKQAGEKSHRQPG